MIIKKSGGKIFGAHFTAAEKQAIDKEIRRGFKEMVDKWSLDIDSLILYVLMNHYHFGAKRLREFYDVFADECDRLKDYYEMDADDRAWLCRQKLKEHGVDLEAWVNEK